MRREYEKFAFCLDQECVFLKIKSKATYIGEFKRVPAGCNRPKGNSHGEHGGCIKTATELYDWLITNGFRIDEEGTP